MGVFDQVISEPMLRRGWRRVRSNRGMAGGEGVDIAAFEKGLAANLACLGAELAAGRYRPGPLQRVEIAKPDGGRRRLAVPPVRDRVVQSAAAIVLDELIDPQLSDASFAYRRGRSVEHAIGRIMTYRLWGAEWVVDGDIERFFDSVPHRRLERRLAGHVRCRRTRALVELWLRRFSRGGRGLAQGAPISPLLANLYLDPVDRAIDRRGRRLVRYADDFVILCPDRARAEQALRRMAALLEAEGLMPHPDKTRVVHFADGFQFLGYRFENNLLLSDGSFDLPIDAATLPTSYKEDCRDRVFLQTYGKMTE